MFQCLYIHKYILTVCLVFFGTTRQVSPQNCHFSIISANEIEGGMSKHWRYIQSLISIKERAVRVYVFGASVCACISNNVI